MPKDLFSTAVIDLYENTYYDDDFQKFIKSIDAKRAHAFNNDEFLLKETDIKYDVNNIGDLTDGRFSILCNNVEFECLLRKKESDKLYVVLSAGVASTTVKQPQFNRWTYGKQLDGNILNIADPMYKQFPNLLVGWYFGTKEICYLDYIVEIVKNVSQKLAIEPNNIIFLGSSSAGYASLYCGCSMPYTTVIAINPQIVIPQYYVRDVNNLSNTLELDYSLPDKYGRFDLRTKIKEAKSTRIILFENARAKEDVLQTVLLSEVMGFKFKYGINKISEKLLIWLYDANGEVPHKEQDYPQLFWCLQALINSEDENSLNDIVPFLSEMWHERYDIKYSKEITLRKINRSINELKLEGNATTVKTENVLNIMETVIEAKDDIWNRIMLTDKLSPNKVYKLNIKNSVLRQGNATTFSVLIRDLYLDYPCYIKSCSIGVENTIIFATPNDCSKLELRLYPGEIYHSNNISIQFNNITLTEYNFVDLM